MPANIETTIIDVEYELTDFELGETAVKICQLDHEEGEIELKKKAAATEWGAKLKSNQIQRKTLCRQHRDGVVVRAVECRFENNYNDGTVDYYSVASGEVVSSREMTSEERQMKLFDEPEEIADIPSATGSEGISIGNRTHIERMSFLQLQSESKRLGIDDYKSMNKATMLQVINDLYDSEEGVLTS
jgi:hypothetical protein